MTGNTKAETRTINAVLWKDWDPIGCGAPEDEYESCVWPVYKLLIDGAPRQYVESYLRWAADVHITMPVTARKLADVVDKLLALGLAKSEARTK